MHWVWRGSHQTHQVRHLLRLSEHRKQNGLFVAQCNYKLWSNIRAATDIDATDAVDAVAVVGSTGSHWQSLFTALPHREPPLSRRLLVEQRQKNVALESYRDVNQVSQSEPNLWTKSRDVSPTRLPLGWHYCRIYGTCDLLHAFDKRQRIASWSAY